VDRPEAYGVGVCTIFALGNGLSTHSIPPFCTSDLSARCT